MKRFVRPEVREQARLDQERLRKLRSLVRDLESKVGGGYDDGNHFAVIDPQGNLHTYRTEQQMMRAAKRWTA